MTSLPQKWAQVAIGELIVLNPKNDCADEAEVGFVPMSLLGTRYLSATKFEPKSWAQVKKGYTHFKPNDVLLAKITPCFENGKAGVASDLPNGIGAGSTEYFVCRPFSGVLAPRYLLAWFKTQEFLRNGASQMTGSVGHKRVPKDFLLHSTLPLAPFSEQKRITEKLDATLARVETCRDQLMQVSLILARFRQSVLAAAVSGRLTEDWRQAHPLESTTELFDRVKNRRGGVSPCSEPRDTESLFQIPRQWLWTNLHFLSSKAEAFCYGVVQPGFDDPDGVFLIRAGDLLHGSVDLSNLRRIPDEVDEEYRRSRLRGGELLITVVGAGIGECAIVPSECAGFNIARALVKVPIVDVSAKYVHFWLSSSTALNLMKGDSREVARPTLNVEQLKSLPVPIPPLGEQEEIVRRVETLLAFADRLEKRVSTTQNAVEKLTPALLVKAFRGELVPQDPNDEPARELLERLAASRASGPTSVSVHSGLNKQNGRGVRLNKTEQATVKERW